MHGAKCSHDPVATITTAPGEANNLMQLQQHSLQTQIMGGQRHLQAGKSAPNKTSLDEVAKGGLANSRYRGATYFRPLLHPRRRVLVRNSLCKNL